MPEVTQEHVQQHQSENSMEGLSPGRSFSPPAFQLQASGNPIQRNKDKDMADASKQPKLPKIELQEADKDKQMSTIEMIVEYGAPEFGAIATRRQGDPDDFDPKDVNQGSVGDCYFLAGLMNVAKTSPQTLRKNIQDNNDGTYTVTLYEKSKIPFNSSFTPKKITVDARFPKYRKGMGDHYFARGGTVETDSNKDSFKEEEIWVKLYEKALAKYKGGYDKIAHGLVSYALELITGEEHSYKRLKKFSKEKTKNNVHYPDQLIPLFTAAKAANENLSVTSKSKRDVKRENDNDNNWAEEHSIVGGHAYAVMDATQNQVTVRNPHGQGVNTPEVAMSYQRFRKYFLGVAGKKNRIG